MIYIVKRNKILKQTVWVPLRMTHTVNLVAQKVAYSSDYSHAGIYEQILVLGRHLQTNNEF